MNPYVGLCMFRRHLWFKGQPPSSALDELIKYGTVEKEVCPDCQQVQGILTNKNLKAGDRIQCTVEPIDIDGDYGAVEGVSVQCSRCRHTVEVYGTSERSIKAGLAMLSDDCPNDEPNWYVADTYKV